MAENEKLRFADKKIVICISGMAGTGKSTLSKRLAQRYNLKCYSGGDVLKELAKAEGYDASREGWWESSEGLNFLKKRENNPKFDREVDATLLEYACEGNVLLDSWTMPWLLKEGFKIWLSASIEKRAARVADRDKITVDEAFRVLEEKEARTKAIYLKLYGFVLGEDFAPFDLVLDTDNLTANEVFEVLCRVIGNVVIPVAASK
ncbi:MAG TPA: cytidylate kinase family protein [Candidatus Limnocylindrales bacterium]|nr:cytidylate kinase family protein [Candidatus Limnocylindrales bacterium]